jgi:putative peptidoglycan lipid II flippase
MIPDTSSISGQIAQPSTVRLVRSAGLTGVATLTSRILGLVRDQVLAALFGAGNEMDAFIVAFRIPNLVRDLFAEGALSAAFVPTFTRHLTQQGRKDAWRLGNNVLNALLITTLTLVVAGMLFADPLVRFYAGDFARVPGKLELTIRLTRVVLPFLTMVTIAAALMGMLNSLHHYFVPALAPATFNVASIVCALALVPVMPTLGLPRIMAIACGAIIGGIGQVAIQWPALRREGFRYEPVLDPGDRGLRQVLLLMGPGAIGLAATQVNIFVNTLLATGQGPGAVSWLTYAFRVMYLPIGLFGVSIGTAVLPAVSRHAAVDDRAGVRTTVSRGIALMLMMNVPAVAGLMLLATPIVQVLFERGQFLPADTVATAAALRLYAVGLIGYSTVRIAAPTFYALGRSRVPVMVSSGAIVLNVVLSTILVHVMGFAGLALGTSIAAIANAAFLLWLLHRRFDGIEVRDTVTVLLKVAAATSAMAIVVVVAGYGLANVLPGAGFTARTVRLGASIGLGIAALAAAARLLRIREFDETVAMVMVRLRSRGSAAS